MKSHAIFTGTPISAEFEFDERGVCTSITDNSTIYDEGWKDILYLCEELPAMAIYVILNTIANSYVFGKYIRNANSVDEILKVISN